MFAVRTLAAGLLTSALAASGFAFEPKASVVPVATGTKPSGKAQGRDGFQFSFSYARPPAYPVPVVAPPPMIVAPTPVVVAPLPARTAPYRPVRLGVATARGWGGLTVVSVLPGTPACEIGLEAGDVLVAANGQHLHNHADLGTALDVSEVHGGHVCLVVRSVRDGGFYQVDADIIPDVVIQGAPPVVMQGVPAAVHGRPTPVGVQGAPTVNPGKTAATVGGTKMGVKNVIRKPVAAPQVGKQFVK